jgi:hypothetical protein
MTRKDLDGTSRAEYLFSAAPTTTRQTTDCAPNGGSARAYLVRIITSRASLPSWFHGRMAFLARIFMQVTLCRQRSHMPRVGSCLVVCGCSVLLRKLPV